MDITRMSLKIIAVHTDYVNQTWPYVEHYIESALSYSAGDYDTAEIKVMLTQGSWQLLVVTDDNEKVHGAIVVSYFNRPTDRVAFVVAIGGRCIITKKNFSKFEDILRQNGATSLEGSGRESIIRLWHRHGMTQKYVVTGKSLNKLGE